MKFLVVLLVFVSLKASAIREFPWPLSLEEKLSDEYGLTRQEIENLPVWMVAFLNNRASRAAFEEKLGSFAGNLESRETAIDVLKFIQHNIVGIDPPSGRTSFWEFRSALHKLLTSKNLKSEYRKRFSVWLGTLEFARQTSDKYSVKFEDIQAPL